MIVCFNCDHHTKQKMDSLLKDGEYKDYSELIAVAVGNLFLMDQEFSEKGSLIIGENCPPRLIAHPARQAGVARPVAALRAEQTPSQQKKWRGVSVQSPGDGDLRIPDLFLFEGLSELPVLPVDVPRVENAGEAFTLDRWLFGQYNKLLPAKANCRALARLIARNGNGANLETASEIAEAAAVLGDFLSDHDQRHGIGRDNALATAFPRTGDEAEKSRARYANQFVGSVDSQGRVSGLLSDYRLAVLAGNDPPALRLTVAGLALAGLRNPVLDQLQDDPTQKFSLEERNFLLDHIRRFVPVEDFAFRAIIAAILEGGNTPDKLDRALEPYIPTDSNRSLSESFLASQRSGALSRMADLGLIARERKGVRVEYITTEQGRDFAKSR
ncbi:MAG TPA: hypothetical protein PLQ35_09235 [bacterium]|nr:hypothetical protein [bacterium]HQL62464.1 hypothetical protein [bacterium]